VADVVTEIEQRHFLHAMSTARRSVPDAMVAEYEAFVKSMKADNAEATGFKFVDALQAADDKGDKGAGDDDTAATAAADKEDEDMY
jgi:hypothetical protein